MRPFVYALFLFVTTIANSQEHLGTPLAKYGSYHSSIGIIAGWNQWRYSFPEIGVGYGVLEELHGYTFRGIYASVEMNPWMKIYGAKLGGWISLPILPLSLGLSTVSYFEQGTHDQTLRPGIGFCYKYLHLTFEYNFTLGNETIGRKNRAQISLKYHLPVFTLKRSAWKLVSDPEHSVHPE